MFSLSANAAPITGEVAFVGSFAAEGGNGPLDLANANAIDFTFGIVAQSTGDFNAANGVVPFFSPVTLNDLTFDPFSPVDPLWAVGVFQFALNELTSVVQGENYLFLAGSGVVSSTNPSLDDTAFSWSFSGGNSGSDGTLQLFSSTALPVAEPSDLATLGLLAISMVAFGLWSLRQRKALQR
jgi:hypothetical protein